MSWKLSMLVTTDFLAWTQLDNLHSHCRCETRPRSISPVTTVPRLAIVITPLIGIVNGLSLARSGSGI
jgi:hypothetical protein